MQFALRTSFVALALTVLTGAQVPPLQPGTLVGTTWKQGGANTVQVIDPPARFSAALAVTGLPLATQFPYQPFVESPQSFLVGINAGSGAGDVYRASWSPTGWTAQLLNSTVLPIHAWSVVRIGTTIFVVGGTGSCTGNNTAVWQVPAAGGAPTLYVALGAVHGAVGLGQAMVALGQVLHVFTFDTCGSGPEHWSIDTATTPPVVRRRMVLPASLRRTGCAYYQAAAAVQADYDPLSGLIVVASRLGDVLWCSPAGGVVKQRTLPTISLCRTLLATELINALAVCRNTGAIVLGDMDRNLEELRCSDGAFRTDFHTLALPSGTVIAGLSQVPGGPEYLPYANGCAQSNGMPACSYATSLPWAGTSGFAFTVDSPSASAWLVLGTSNAQWGTLPLPLSLAGHGAPGCSLATSADMILAGTPNLTATGFQLSLPLSAAWIGVAAYTQWLLADSTNALGLVLSDARRTVIR